MPFKSEKQRRYLWANEPEIARDWTDTYGSGIHKALGGRIPFRRGSDRHAGTGGGWSPGVGSSSPSPSPSRSPSPSSGSGTGPHGEGAWSGPTYSAPKTVTVAGPHRGDGIGSQTFDINKRTIDKQDEYRRGAYERAHPFLSKIKRGLGSLSSGLRYLVNPMTLVGGGLNFLGQQGLGRLLGALNLGYGTNLFNPYGNTRNYVDPDEEEDFAWENINYNPNALTRLEQLGIMNPDILPENRPYESYESIFDDRNLMADLSQVQQGILNRPDVEFSYGENPTQTIENLLNPGSGFRGHDINEAPATQEDIENFYKGTYKPTIV